MNVSCSGVVQNVSADEMPQLTSAAGVAAVVTDRQAVEYSTVDSSSIAPVDDALEDSSMLTVASCLPPEDTAVPEPALTVDADHAQNCTSGGTFTGSWLFLYSLYAFVPLWLFITRTVFPVTALMSFLLIYYSAQVTLAISTHRILRLGV